MMQHKHEGRFFRAVGEGRWGGGGVGRGGRGSNTNFVILKNSLETNLPTESGRFEAKHNCQF